MNSKAAIPGLSGALLAYKEAQTEATTKALFVELYPLTRALAFTMAKNTGMQVEIAHEAFHWILDNVDRWSPQAFGDFPQRWVSSVVKWTTIGVRRDHARSIWGRIVAFTENIFSMSDNKVDDGEPTFVITEKDLIAPEPINCTEDEIGLSPKVAKLFEAYLNAFEKLGEDCRLLVTLHYQEGLTINEIALQIYRKELPIKLKSYGRRNRKERTRTSDPDRVLEQAKERLRYCVSILKGYCPEVEGGNFHHA